MAAYGRKHGYAMALNLMKTLTRPTDFASNSRSLSGLVSTEIISSHTAKWMQDMSKKSPMELINEVPPIKVEGRIVACEGDSNPALGHPIEFICLDLKEPAICKYCGLRYVQDHGDHHH
uniref:Zinc finger CHCC-type domain-containing protein n=1 Tax=Davidia involucrata TaxID=16924 RepID=A0A5B7ALG7_DAVIN